MQRFGGSPKCPSCDKSVFFNERVHVLGDYWHKSCFKCLNCNKGLEVGAQFEHKKKVYCKTCHFRLYGPKGCGYGTGAELFPETGLEKDGSKKNYALNSAAASEMGSNSSSSAKGNLSMPFQISSDGNRCVSCDKTVGFAEKLRAMGMLYHRNCFQCKSCEKTLAVGSFSNNGGDPYCGTCYNQIYGPSGFGRVGTVTQATRKG